jgi:RND family efflux transporter MFP subunit
MRQFFCPQRHRSAGSMKKKTNLLLFVLCVFLLLVKSGFAAEENKAAAKEKEQPQGPPPALVEVAQITHGEAEPMVEFVGTVYYARKSDVAAEVEGVVEQVFFEEGYRVKKGEPLVSLGSDILDTVISATRADYELVLVELEQAQKELNRREPLYREGSVSESAYDEYFFKSKMLQSRSLSLKASLDRLLLEKEKKKIRAPFDGIVVQKNAEKGEWIDDGGMVAVIADDSVVDVEVNVPAEMLKYLEPGKELTVQSENEKLTGQFLSFVPKGDVATRTFDVKIRLQNAAGLIEGMEARALIPAAAKSEGLKAPRDALLDKFGQNVVWLVKDSAAKMVPVQVTGYDGMYVGIAGPGLENGDTVVVKGNERLREGQAVMIGNK